MSDAAYELDRLGWLQFEELGEQLLELEAGLPALRWSGHSDWGRLALTDGPLLLPALGIELDGPVAVLLAWARRRWALMPAERLRELVSFPLKGVERKRVLVVTNLAAAEARKSLLDDPRLERVFTDADAVVGVEELGRCLDRNAELRARVPSVLGLRDLGGLIDERAGERSTLDIEQARALARVFVPTRAYAAARNTLARHRFVVLTGPPEMGKTAIARMLALTSLCDGAEAYECSSPKQLWAAFREDARQVFVADDAFGSTEYRADAAELWARELGEILPRLGERHKLVWTSRPAPLKAGLRRVRRERGAECFPAPGEVLVDASALSLQEKALILYRHAKDRDASQIACSLLRSTGVTIVEHPHFTPERIRRFASTRLTDLEALAGRSDERSRVASLVEQELSSPTEAMLASFNALPTEHRELLVALLDAPAGLIDERELATTVRRHHDGGLPRPPAELIDRLADHFLSIAPLGIGWVHPSWRDLVIDELRRDGERRSHFLSRCGLEGVLLALSEGGGAAGERALPLLLCDADWDMLAARLATLARELDDHDLTRVMQALTSLLTAASLEPAKLTEVRDLATYLLGCTRRRWDRSASPLPTFALAAWFELRAAANEPTQPPSLLRTWLEAHPETGRAEQLGRASLTRIDDWLALAQLLRRYAREELVELGFPDRDEDLLVVLVPRLADVEDRELRPLATGVLTRIASLLEQDSALQELVSRAARIPAPPTGELWWAPSDIEVPPSFELASSKPAVFTREDVERVLRDL